MACNPRNKPLGSSIIENAAGQAANILSVKPLGKYITGARVTLRINKKLAAFAFGISWKIDTEVVEINTIDDYTPYELAPRRIHVTGSISAFHIPGRSPTKEQFQSNVLSFLFHQYVEIEARDSQTDEILFYAPKAVITTRSETVNAGEIARMSLNFTAIGWQDEMVPTPPKGIDAEGEGAGGAQSAIGRAIDTVKNLF